MSCGLINTQTTVYSQADAANYCDRARILLIAPRGSYRISPFVDTAVGLGFDILIASEGKHSLVSTVAQGLYISLNETDAAVRVIKREAARVPFSAILGTDDTSIELAAIASKQLGLPHNDPTSVQIARRKDYARARLLAAGLLVPVFHRINLDQPLKPQLKRQSYPCVVKPLAMSASRGVIRSDNEDQLLQSISRVEHIISELADEEEKRHVLIETYIPGIEIAVEGILTDGDLKILAIFDKPDPLNGPFFEETYYVTPSRLNQVSQCLIKEQVLAACYAFGLKHGPIHAECRINQEGVWILEIAARTIGGLCSRLFGLSIGSSLEEIVLKHAIGAPCESYKNNEAAGVLMIPIPKAGVLRRIEGITAATKIPYIEEIVIQIREGHELLPLPEGSSYLGFILSRAPTPDIAEQALRQAHARLNIVVAPLWKGITLNRPRVVEAEISV